MLYGDFTGEEKDEAFFVLQEMSTILKYLASEIDAALERDGDVDTERLSKIARALNASHNTLIGLSEAPECDRILVEKPREPRRGHE